MDNPQNIAVIGAGIMGILTAYFLQNRFSECKVTLYDVHGFPADNASFAAGGMIAPLSELDHMPQSFLPAGFDAIEHWAQIARDIKQPFEFADKGSLFITHAQDRHLLERFKSLLPEQPNDNWEEIGKDKIATIEPNLAHNNFNQALFMKREAHLHPQKAMRALLDQIRHKEQQSLNPEDINAEHDWIIDCRGLGAKTETPYLRGVKGEILIVRNSEFSLSRPLRLMHPRYPLYIVPRDDHHFMIGATIIENESDHVALRSGMELMSALYSIDKSFGEAEIIEVKSGVRPSYPDNLPHIHINGNMIRANGLYRHGYLFSPVLASEIMHYIAKEKSKHLHLFLNKDDKDEDHFERSTAHA